MSSPLYSNEADAAVADLPDSGPLVGTESFYADNGRADVQVTTNRIKAFAQQGLSAGDVSGLGPFATDTDAANLTGTIDNARLSAVPNSALANSSVTISGHPLALGGTLSLVPGDAGLGNVTNDAQTKAAIVPNTAPAAGRIPVGNAGGTAYAPVAVSGDATLSSAGALIVSKTNGTAFGSAATKNVGTSPFNVVQLDASSRLPAVDGSQLLNISATSVPDYTTLQSVNTAAVKAVFVWNAGGRNGFFRFQSGDLSGFVTNDPQKGIYVPPTSDLTGASGAWVRQREVLIVNPLWAGATGDGVTDDHAALQAAVNLAQAIFSSVYIPPGYKFHATVAISVTSRLRIYGEGYTGDAGAIYQTSTVVPNGRCSVITCGASNSAFTIRTNDAVQFENLQIWYPNTGVSSSIIAIDTASAVGAGNANTYSVFRDLYISGAGVGLNLLDCYDFTVDNVTVANHTGKGIAVKSLNYPNFCDGIITHCKLLSRTATAHIYAESGGGLRIVNNKLNYGNDVNTIGIWVNLMNYQVGGVSTAFSLEPFIANDNSIEGQVQGIVVTRQAGSKGQISQMAMSGNQVWAGGSALNVVGDGSGDKIINGFAIGANYFSSNANSATVVSLDSVQNGAVAGNTMSGGAGSGDNGFALTNFDNVKHSGNVFTSNAPFTLATPSVPASGVTVTNTKGCTVEVNLSGTSLVSVAINGTTVLNQTAGAAYYSAVLRPNDTIMLGYTGGTTTWLWRPTDP